MATMGWLGDLLGRFGSGGETRLACASCGDRFTAMEFAHHALTLWRQGTSGLEICCRVCHEWMPYGRISVHEREHFERGFAAPTQGEIQTLPRQRRYVHATCGTVTEMPLNIQRVYIADPFRFSATSVCSPCGEVDIATLRWLDTREMMVDEDVRVKAEWLRRNGKPRCVRRRR
jgi:hypothetical protein